LGRPTRIFTKGDAVGCLDRSVPVDQVVGRVERIIRGEAHHRPTTPLDRARCVWQAAGYGLRRWMRRRRHGAAPDNPAGRSGVAVTAKSAIAENPLVPEATDPPASRPHFHATYVSAAGSESLTLKVGGVSIRLTGLSAAWLATLQHRYGIFCAPPE